MTSRLAKLLASTVVTVSLTTAATAHGPKLPPVPHIGWEKNANPQVALAALLFWESPVKLSKVEARALAHAVRNRVLSTSFPNTYREVAAQGARRGRRSGCQFSFACDGHNDHPKKIVSFHPKDMKKHWPDGWKARWKWYYQFAVEFLKNPGEDPTRGADHYFTGKKPYWYKDLDPKSIQKIESHIYGKSTKTAAIKTRVASK